MLEAALGRIETLTSTPAKEVEDEDALDDGDFIKKSDIPGLLKAEKEKETAARTAYESTYLSKVLEIGKSKGMDDDLQDEIYEEMMANFNVIHTNDPGIDAEKNFNQAHIAILERKVSGKPENPLKGGKPKVPVGVGGGTDNKPKKPKAAVKLDDHAAEFIKDSKLSVDEAAEILSKSEKPHLRFHNG
jgi:hypothetical protein